MGEDTEWLWPQQQTCMHMGEEEEEPGRKVLGFPIVHHHRGALYVLPVHPEPTRKSGNSRSPTKKSCVRGALQLGATDP